MESDIESNVEDKAKPARKSVPLNDLNDNEAIFRELILQRKLGEAENFLKQFKDVNINAEDYQGLTALHYAVKAGNKEAVHFLLARQEIELKDVLLHAVATGNINITETILSTLRARHFEEDRTYPNSVQFSGDITPLLLAAQCGDFDMIQMLYRIGHRLKEPDKPRCQCEQCKEDTIKYASCLSHIRLNYYKGASHPAYICQISNDPILFGFELDAKIQDCADVDTEFTMQYLKLGEEVRNFVVDFISEVRNTIEMETILKRTEGYNPHEKNAFPRLQLAVDYAQKEFVANALVQQVLHAHWHGNSFYWHRWSLISKCGDVLFRIFAIPFIVTIILIAPNSKLGKEYRDPVNKYANYLASYLTFVSFLYIICILEKQKRSSGPPSKGTEYLIMIYVIALGFPSLNQLRKKGPKRYFKVPRLWYDLMISLLFLVTFCLWYKSNRDAEIRTGPKTERKYWKSMNYILLHEGFFIIFCILSFGRLFFFITLSSRLGPMQVSLEKMGKPIFFFLVVWFLLIAAFAIPMTNLYVYYEGMKQTDAHGETVVMLDSFTNFVNAFGTLFWAIFAMSPTESVDIVIENSGGGNVNKSTINHHAFTETVGTWLFGGYQFLVFVALLNTLIAILSNTYQKVVDNADVEWKFSRTKLWLFFLNDVPDLPNPFNIFYIFNIFRKKNVLKCKEYFQVLCGKIKGAKARFSFQRLFYIEYAKAIEKKDEGEYEDLMVELIQRYFCSKESIEQENS